MQKRCLNTTISSRKRTRQVSVTCFNLTISYYLTPNSTRSNDFTFVNFTEQSLIIGMKICDIFVLARNISSRAFLVALNCS